jgi:hypothetical protein
VYFTVRAAINFGTSADDTLPIPISPVSMTNLVTPSPATLTLIQGRPSSIFRGDAPRRHRGRPATGTQEGDPLAIRVDLESHILQPVHTDEAK